MDYTIFWFRRDLRLEDNSGLFFALSENKNIIPLFIFDTEILSKLTNKKDKRVSLIYDFLKKINSQLINHNSSLLVKHGKPLEIFKTLTESFNIKNVYTNHDYEPYAKLRDEQISDFLKSKNINFKTFKDQVIFEKSEITKDDNTPYTVFTPYSKKWKLTLNEHKMKSFPSEQYKASFTKLKFDFPSIESIGFEYSPSIKIDLDVDLDVIKNYDKTRDFPSINGTSKMSPHLRFGTVSVRKLIDIAKKNNETYLNELIWREFYMMILWHFPHAVENSFKQKYDLIKWENDENKFQKWCEGKTGYPIVDAGMRELNETGFMHNRVRMIVASFLTKHLLIDWRWGEAYFAQKLLDFELSSNNGGWQWAASSGCDAAPYFRIFNPYEQTKKFDSKLNYIKKWCPEFQEIDYPKPIVEHSKAREKALRTYKEALEN